MNHYPHLSELMYYVLARLWAGIKRKGKILVGDGSSGIAKASLILAQPSQKNERGTDFPPSPRQRICMCTLEDCNGHMHLDIVACKRHWRGGAREISISSHWVGNMRLHASSRSSV